MGYAGEDLHVTNGSSYHAIDLVRLVEEGGDAAVEAKRIVELLNSPCCPCW